MRPLLWKEMRDLRPWIFGICGIALALMLLCQSKRFERAFLETYVYLLPFPVLIAAAALGAGQVARERSSRTMEFLLTRPVGAAAIILTKFLAGTIALALLLPVLVGLGYQDPAFRDTNGVMVFRHAVGFWQLLLIAFPRAWCVYAVALFVSALVNRTAKAAAGVVILIIAIAGLGSMYSDLRPFAETGPWIWVSDPFIQALRLARDPDLLRFTEIVLALIALAIAASAAMIFRRRPGHAFANRTLVIAACVMIGVAVAASKIDANVMPVTRSVATLELHMDSQHDLQNMAASGNTVAMVSADSVALLDFSDPAHPRKVGETAIELWELRALTMADGVAYLLGARKAMPVDDIQVLAAMIVDNHVEIGQPVTLGKVSKTISRDTIAVQGHYLFADVIRQRHCRIEVYDLSSGQPVAAVEVDAMRPPPPGTAEKDINPGSMQMVLGGHLLYVSSPAALTTLDISDSEHPRIASRIPYRSAFADYYPWSAVPRRLKTDGRFLFEDQAVPAVWNIYGLADAARPAPAGHAPAVDHEGILSGPGVLYQAWHGAVMEFRAARDGFEGIRVLSDGNKANPWVAVAGDRVYTYKQVEDRRLVSQYR